MEKCDLISTRLITENATFIVAMRSFNSVYGGKLHGWICAIMCSYAALSNIVNIVVLTRPKMQNPVNVVLTGMAASDFVTMTSYIIFASLFYIDSSQRHSYGSMLFIEVHMFVTVVLHSTSIWLNVLVAFLRCIILRHSYSVHKPWMGLKFIGCLVMIIAIAITMLSIPMLLAYQVGHIRNDVYDVDITKRAIQNNCSLLRTFLWTQGILFKVMPCFLLAIVIICLVFRVKSAHKRSLRLLARNNGVRKAKKKDRTSTLLICVTSFALVTEIPQGVVAILYGIYPFDVVKFLYPVVGDLMDLMGLANSSVNFILYYTMSTQYRTTFWHLFLPHKVYMEIYGDTHIMNMGKRPSGAYITKYGVATTDLGTFATSKESGWNLGSQESLTVNGYIMRSIVAAFARISWYIATKFNPVSSNSDKGRLCLLSRRSTHKSNRMMHIDEEVNV